jgi:hypothetical protein
MQRILIGVFTAACFGIAVYSSPATARSGMAGVRANLQPATNQRMDVAQVLARAGIWGKDFPSVLAFLESWKRINEQKIYVFPDRVVGGTQYRKREEAQTVAARLTEAMKTTRSKPKPQFADLLKGVPPQGPSQLRIEAVRFLPDDDFFHVAWSNPSLQFLKPNVSMATVISRLGPPEKTTQELIQNETERRPVVLTLHSYAGGAIVFAESDWAPVPGTVDRVILDVTALTAALY